MLVFGSVFGVTRGSVEQTTGVLYRENELVAAVTRCVPKLDAACLYNPLHSARLHPQGLRYPVKP